MEIFEARIRGFHARAVENIMSRTTGFAKIQPREKAMKPKGDNIATYLRKFEVDRENLNLAKRILLCQSQHNHKFYQKQWKKTQNFLRVRSNFKRGLTNEQPRIFKFQPIMGKGNCLVSLIFTQFESSPVHFRTQNLYNIRVLIKNHSITPTNATFTLNSLGSSAMCFYIPSYLKKKKITCKISQVKENESYDKGKMQINLACQEQQQVMIINKQGKGTALVSLKVIKQIQDKKQKKKENMTASLQITEKEKQDEGQCESQQNL